MRRVGYGVWLLAVACLYFFENNTGTRAALAASLLVPALSGACALWTARRGVSLALEAPERVARGEAARCRCLLARESARWGCAIEATLFCANELAGEELSRPVRIAGEGAVFTAQSAHCGTLRLRLADVRVRDWFGLWRVGVDAGAEASVTVLPRLRPALLDGLAECPPTLRAAPARGGAERADGDVRAYLPGDPVRRIHWKLSAKTDRLLVREDARAEETRPLLLLDTVAPRREAGASAAAEALLSVSAALTAAETAHEIGWIDQETRTPRRAVVEDGRSARAAAEELLDAAASEAGEDPGRAVSGEDGGRIVLLFSAREAAGSGNLRAVPLGGEDAPIVL